MTLAADVRTHRKLWKQHFIMQNRAVFEGIIHDFSFSSGAHDIRRPQQSELVRAGCLIERQHAGEVSHAHFGYGQRAYYFRPRDVAARREKFRQGVQGGVVRHIVAYEFHRFFVKQTFHSRIIIRRIAQKTAVFDLFPRNLSLCAGASASVRRGKKGGAGQSRDEAAGRVKCDAARAEGGACGEGSLSDIKKNAASAAVFLSAVAETVAGVVGVVLRRVAGDERGPRHRQREEYGYHNGGLGGGHRAV